MKYRIIQPKKSLGFQESYEISKKNPINDVQRYTRANTVLDQRETWSPDTICLVHNFVDKDRFLTKSVPMDRAESGLSNGTDFITNQPLSAKL